MKKIAVLGGGPYGIALANIIGDNGEFRFNPVLWSYKPEEQAIPLEENVEIVADINEAVKDANYVFIAVNTQFWPTTIKMIDKHTINDKTKFAIASKGLVEDGGVLLQSKYLEDKLGVDQNNIAVISGPNLADELNRRVLSSAVVASKNSHLSRAVGMILPEFFRAIPFDDVYGVQMCGALKNAYANILGIEAALSQQPLFEKRANPFGALFSWLSQYADIFLDAMSGHYQQKKIFGHNTKSGLFGHCLTEMEVLLKELYPVFNADEEYNPACTIRSPAGVGDLHVTSDAGRNFRVGWMIGHGYSLPEVYNIFGNQRPGGPDVVRIVYPLIRGKDVAPFIEQAYYVMHEQANTPEERREACLNAVDKITQTFDRMLYKNGKSS